VSGLVLRDVSKRFDEKLVLESVSLEVGRDELLVLLGPSGCGKSTLLRVVAGLETCDSGEIYLNDKRVEQLRPRDRDVALVFQNYSLYPHMTVEQNLSFPLKVARVAKGERTERVHTVAAKLGLSDKLKDKPGQLSGGQRQRVALGRAIIRQPAVFLLDEPLSNLDADLRVKMRREIARLQKELSRPMIHVTHDQAEALSMADRIVLLNEGIIQQIGTPEELYGNPANRFVAEFIGSPKINMIEAAVENGRLTPFAFDMSGVADRRVLVGLRPEAIRFGGERGFPAVVSAVEYLGDQYICRLEYESLQVVAARQSDAPAVDDQIRIGFLSSDLLFFDPQTGARLDFHSS
jgi:ABC-type sugar transport system ATPase subunit